MKDFNFYAPTEVVFGRESEQHISSLVRKYGGSRVLLHYGGESARRSGLLDLVKQQLYSDGIQFTELGGVVPNPQLSMVYEGIKTVRRDSLDFILAIGGGSVIDSAKAIGYGVPYDGDVWDFYSGRAQATTCMPIGCVLTIPAAGSEMSYGCVITNDLVSPPLKWSYNCDLGRMRFAVMNPERTYTLPPYQTAAGVTDIMMHTMERYFSQHTDMLLTDAIAEALLRTVKECGERVLSAPENYQLRAQIMWGGSLAHNNLTECGLQKDFATHGLEHELSALYGVTHGAGLAALWGSWARYVMNDNINRFAQFAVNVCGVRNDFSDPVATALAGIRAMEDFYHRIGMPASIPELLGRTLTDEELRILAERCSREKTIAIGNFRRLHYDDMLAIYTMANKK